ncbi:lantibiotic dehydratase family protein [Chryseobacterium sp. ERMR1:04]|uniref:lantibiotic dehydratase family protein n=1 Tax=Chryseobacterium sp. ERMR1:04 TaxID=1705393 RepID=UPI0006C847E0|nr:lantibiotic dehydratase family protein [Chryseobacterium sp. ERMR1:04]KPH11200.1 lantibiotic dehydratase [Chryseobacterium sp. ERMR1:04]
MSRFPYNFFDNYVFRTPLFLRKNFYDQFNKEKLSDDELKAICENPVFQEAIYLASPYLYEELNLWLYSEKNLTQKQHKKLIHTLLKYYGRMSPRCTPFGLFSGVGLGRFSNDELILRTKTSTPSILARDTRLDMHFLVALSKKLTLIPDIKTQLLFFPNNSIYRIGDKIRYIEYEYHNGKRAYVISSALFSEELKKVLHFSIEGKTSLRISEILVNNEITLEDTTEFIEELIENQVLVSELEPNVSGTDFLDEIISVLSRIGAEKESSIVISIKEKLIGLDGQVGNSISLYSEIEKLIQSFQIEYEQKYLFQTDLYFQNTFELPNHWKKELKKGISFINKITLLQQDTHLSKFKKAFYERFENQEMPLSIVLDTEVGIGYKQNIQLKGVHPYLNDLELPFSKNLQDFTIKINPIHKICNDKLQEALFENQFVIELFDEDFKDFEETWDDLPDTISFMSEIISESGAEKLVLGGGGGSSAANLLGRFCSEKSEVQNLTKEIVQKEEALHPDYISAEIIHLPEARIGNVIRRSSLRNYEIPYLAQSILPNDNQIPIDDLYISLQNDRLVLRSNKLNKEVKPYLTNAHNYSSNSLTVYHFLCDLYSENKRSGLYFDWGDLKYIYIFLPRVEYKNIILSKAQWTINEEDIGTLFLLMNDAIQFLNELKNWRLKRKIPAWIQWIKYDNTLTLNLENYDLAQIFLETIKKQKSIVIEEFLYNENDDYMRQFVFSMYKDK